MSIIKPRPMQPKPERPPTRYTPAWYAWKREQANARRTARERRREAAGEPEKRPRKRMKPFSTTPKAQERKWQYESAKEEWREERVAHDGYLRCEWHDEHWNRCKRRASKHPHHKAGRIGENLFDKRKFMAICEGLRGHHRWIHDNPKAAEERGFIIRENEQH